MKEAFSVGSLAGSKFAVSAAGCVALAVAKRAKGIRRATPICYATRVRVLRLRVVYSLSTQQYLAFKHIDRGVLSNGLIFREHFTELLTPTQNFCAIDLERKYTCASRLWNTREKGFTQNATG